MGFTCSVCGEHHADELRDIRMTYPSPIYTLGAEERAARTWLADDFAVLDRRSFFVRGLLELPVPETADRFGYGTWVEVSQPDFTVLLERWHDPEQFEPVECTVANELEPYDQTTGLAAMLVAVSPDELPIVELADAEHPLVRDQRAGISRDRVNELAAVVLHPPSRL